MVRIIDRRFDSKNKSAVNRSASCAASRTDPQGGGRCHPNAASRTWTTARRSPFPARTFSEPIFAAWPRRRLGAVHSRQRPFPSGDQVERPQGGGGGSGGKAGQQGRRSILDDFVFTLSREEFLDIFFDDLALPNLVKTQLARITNTRQVRAGFTQSGVPTNINVVRSPCAARRPPAWPSAAPMPPAKLCGSCRRSWPRRSKPAPAKTRG
jgi:uncharacterized sporulation protein YeaH/YhbH (DUF444 family)